MHPLAFFFVGYLILFITANLHSLYDTWTSSTLYCVREPYTITTLSPNTPNPKCFRVRIDVITEILERVPSAEEGEKVVWLNGYVLPGIIESHGHILQYGEMLESVSLYEAESVDDVKSRIKEWLGRHEGEGYGGREKWIRGVGWDQAHFGGVMPTAKQLAEDPELEDLYIMLDRVDIHCVWTSEKVLSLLPDPLPESPPGGEIIKNPGPGVFCDNAMDNYIYPLAPKPDAPQKVRWLKTAMEELNKVGITAMSDAGMRMEDVKILQELARRDELTVRIRVMAECDERNTFCHQELRTVKVIRDGSGGGDMLLFGGIKLFADGALGSWGAALLEPYSDKPETSGMMLINETELTEVVKKFYEWDYQINIHAIGDRANRAAINAFEAALGSDCHGCNQEKRLRIEHAQIIHPDDQIRIANMGILPSIQPTHATSDMAYASSRLGEERLSNFAYRMRSFFPPVHNNTSSYPGPVLGSDFPVEPPNPFHGIYAAVTRLNPKTGTSPSGKEGWYPEESLSIEQAIHGFTRNAAWGWKLENKMGAIEIGKWADWIVVDEDVMGMEGQGVERLRNLTVLGTWVKGKNVWAMEGGELWNLISFIRRAIGFGLVWQGWQGV
ncbi:putative amidohydrolase 3 protein [Botrytis fragariae]|uniref:Putative amidohydrolase 3 protein n=1 Tax=Botrytis fragariae TaxID=1964551 RepID=A0A8H6B4D6_9HELO|nr:putative amidohydrolase 3 protein [Botrytis fragariae]KAF5878885.1 putative amidohydrolase 3 protein [Botrytis fragariae]